MVNMLEQQAYSKEKGIAHKWVTILIAGGCAAA
jgi:hypothetical protein